MSLILSGTDGLSDIDGSAATPAIRGTDTNTGIFFPAADTIAFAEGGAESMRIDSSGNVGIGTTTPSNRVSIVTASGSDGIVSVKSPLTETAGVVIDGGTSSNKGSVLKFSKNASVLWQMGTDSAIIGATSDNFHLYGGGANAILFSTNATERMRIASAGQIGIGGANYGTSGQVLTSGGSGAAPTWSDAPAPAAGKLLASGNVTTSSGVTLSWATTGIKRIQVFAAISASSNFDAYMQVGNTTSVISTANYTVSRMAIQSTTISGNSSGSSGLWQLTSTVASPPSVLQAEIALNSNGNPVMKCEIQQNDSTYGLYKAAGFFVGNWTQFQSVRVWWDGGNGGRVTVVGFTE